MLLIKFIRLIFVLSSKLLPLVSSNQWSLQDETTHLVHEVPTLHSAFVQTGEELYYMSSAALNDYKNKHYDTSIQVYKLDQPTGQIPLQFDTNEVNFGECAVGHTATKKLTVKNTLSKPIIMEAIIVDSLEFHSTFFESVSIRPQGSTSVELAFLPRAVGKTAAAVQIYTSEGLFLLKVKGDCVSNPYRLKPFVGHKIPFNGKIVSPVKFYNPYRYPLQVTEISSSGGHVFVEMPTFSDEKLAADPVSNWLLQPYQQKNIANLLLLGVHTDSTIAFLRIGATVKTPIGDVVLDDIVITVPMEVIDTGDIFSPNDIIDFGLMRNDERSEPEMLSIYQYKLRESMLEFEALYVIQGDPQGIYMEFASVPPISIPPPKAISQAGEPASVVKVYFEASKVELPQVEAGRPTSRVSSGMIIAVSRGGNYNITVPFTATVFKGDLVPVGNDMAIQQNLRPPHQRTVRVFNDLPFGVAVYNVSLSPDAQEFFSIRLIDTSIEIAKEEQAPVFILKYNKKIPAGFDNSYVYLNTNASTYRLLLQTYEGKMKIELTSVEKESFDFGYVQKNDTRTIRFIVWNPNSAILTLNNLAVPTSKAYRLYYVGSVQSGTEFVDVTDVERTEFCQPQDFDVRPSMGAIFDFELKVPQDGKVYEGKMLFESEIESKVFQVTYKVFQGTLQSIPAKLSFGKSFPGKVSYRSLQVFNSFDEDMVVTRLTTLSNDPRFFFETFDSETPPVLRRGRLANLGRVMFCPSVASDHDFSYLGFPLSSNDGQWFTHSLTLPANLAEVDAYLYKRRADKFAALVAAGKNFVNTTVVLDTDKAKNIKIQTSAELTWPRLLSPTHVHFPITALGNYTIQNLTLTNPTNMPIVVQVIPLVIYPDAESLVRLFRDNLDVPLTSRVEMNETLMFSLRDTELFTLKPDSPVPMLREQLEQNVPTSVPRFTLSMILQPHMKVRLRVGFLPSDDELRSSLLLIRNNLTVLEPVVMYGKGGRLGMKVEGVAPRSKTPLLFEIRHDHLTDCNNPKRLMHKLHSTLTVRRPFVVHNTGDVRFTVTNMSINNVPCENRGFRILNCYPFHLEPNETYALDVAYTPDFLTTTNEADLQLYMHMNGSAWLFPLAATVPADMLAKCHQALPRPPFENIMYYSCVTALIFCLVCILACAYLEGDRAIAYAIRQHHARPRTVFDLKNIGKQTTEVEKKEVVATPDWNMLPSTLRVSTDAWFVSRFSVYLANRVVHLVHFVWKWYIWARQTVVPPPVNKEQTPKKKKKAPIVNFEVKKKVDSKSKATPSTPATNNNNKEVAKNSPKAKNGKKVPPSPKPANPVPTKKAAQQPGRKKSGDLRQADVKDRSRSGSKDVNRETTANVAKLAPEAAKQQKRKSKKEEAKKGKKDRSVSAVPSEQPIQEVPLTTLIPEPESQEVSAEPSPAPVPRSPPAPESLQPADDDDLLQFPILDAEQSMHQLAALQTQMMASGLLLNNLYPSAYPYPMLYDPAAMMAQLDSQWDPSQWAAAAAAAAAMSNFDYQLPPMGVPPTTNMPPIVPERPTGLPLPEQDDDLSVHSGDSDMPDWADEIVDMSGDVDAGMRAMVDATNEFFEIEQGGHSESLGPQIRNERRRTIGSEKKKDFQKTPGKERSDAAKAQDPVWPMPDLNWQSTSSATDPFDLNIGLGSTTAASGPFGNTMFAGRDFNLWSDSAYDPSTAWANLTGHLQDEKKKK